jgi:SprA-related family
MINPNVPSNFANAISPFSPLGRQPVGEESADSRNTPFKPVEESSELSRTDNRRSPDERPGELDQRLQLDDRSQDEGSRRRDDGQERRDEQRQQDQAEQQRLDQEQQQVRQLAARDAEVRAHERAHSSVGGALAGAPRYDYERGPDGVNYAVSGEVSINVSAVEGDPEATLEVARQVRQAALAPAEPSAQDRRVAARASQLEIEARQDLTELRNEERITQEQEAIEARVQREQEADEREKREEERREAREEALERAETQPASTESAADRFADINNRSIDINRRLVEIGVNTSQAPAGGIFDQRV